MYCIPPWSGLVLTALDCIGFGRSGSLYLGFTGLEKPQNLTFFFKPHAVKLSLLHSVWTMVQVGCGT